MTTTRLLVLFLVTFGFFNTGIVSASSITFNDFSSTAGLTLSGGAGAAVTSDGNVLRLTNASYGQVGSAFSSTTINAAKFSTSFEFRMTSPGGGFDGTGTGADGLVFVVQPVSSSIGGYGGGLGYSGIWPSIGVEFDTWYNDVILDPDSNHIGINQNGNTTSLATLRVSPSFNDGSLWYAWINYDGTDLEVRANQTGERPDAALISYSFDIPGIIGTNLAYVGFTAGTGGAWENHDIISWQYLDDFNPVTPTAPVPEPGTLLLLGSGLMGLAVVRNRFNK